MTDIEKFSAFLQRFRNVIFDPACISSPVLRKFKIELMEALAEFKTREQPIRWKVEDYDRLKQESIERSYKIEELQSLVSKIDNIGSVSVVQKDSSGDST